MALPTPSIGSWYSTGAVVVGQAACFVAPQNTALPSLASLVNSLNAGNPFDLGPWKGITLNANGATSATITVVTNQGSGTTPAQTFASLTAAQLQTALNNLVNVGNGSALPYVKVTGVSGGPFTILFDEVLGAVSLTASGTGGTPTVTNGLWTNVGATDAGWSVGGQKNITSISIEEQSVPVFRGIASQDFSFTASVAEDTVQVRSYAYNFINTVVAAVSGTPGYVQQSMSDQLQRFSAALLCTNEYGLPGVWYVPANTITTTGTTAYRRIADKRQYALSIDSVANINQIQYFEITAPALP